MRRAPTHLLELLLPPGTRWRPSFCRRSAATLLEGGLEGSSGSGVLLVLVLVLLLLLLPLLHVLKPLLLVPRSSAAILFILLLR